MLESITDKVSAQTVGAKSCGDWFYQRSSCPICEGRDFSEKYSRSYSAPELTRYIFDFYSEQGSLDFKKLVNSNFVLAECRDCTCLFQVNIPNEKFMLEIYEKWLDPEKTFKIFESERPLEHSFWHLQGLYKLLSLPGKPPTHLKIFDFGMGWGNWLALCRSLGCEVFGSELSPFRKNYAISRGVHALDYSEINRHQFDIINLDQVLEHVANPKEILDYLKTCLSPGGVIRIGVPNGNDISSRMELMDWTADKKSPNSLNAIAPLEHINCFNGFALQKLIELCGLKRVYPNEYPKCEILNEPPHIPYPTQRIKIALKDIARPFWRKLFPLKATSRENQDTDIIVVPK